MKPEQLLDSISGVGEDLLAASENPIRIERRRPWLGAAVAALLVLAAGVGGFAAWKTLAPKSRQKTPVVSTELPTLSSREPTVDDPILPVQPGALPPFSVGWRELSGTQDAIRYCTEEELQTYLDFVSPGLDAAETGSLPVYRDLSCQEDDALPSGIHVYYSQARLTGLLQEAAEAMGLTILSEKPEFFYVADFYRNSVEPVEYGPDEPVYMAQVHTDQGTLLIRGDGQISLMYNTDYTYTVPDAGPWDPFSSANATAISGFIKERLSFLPEDTALGSLGGMLESPISSNFGYLWTFPRRTDPVRNFLSQQLNQIRLITFDGSKIYGFTIQTPFFLKGFQSDALVTVPECWMLMGTYPVISPEEAKNRIAQGQFLLPNRVKDLEVDTDALSRGEVVYLTDQALAIQLPYYRFWVRTGTGTDGSSWFTPVYVPAVSAEFLVDYPGTGESPITDVHVESAAIARDVAAQLSALGVEEEFYALLGQNMDQLYENWQGAEEESYPRFGFLQTASTADGEWYWQDSTGNSTQEAAAGILAAMLMKSLEQESTVKDMGYELQEYSISIPALCSNVTLPELPGKVWIFNPEIAVKYSGQYGLNGEFRWSREHGLADEDGFAAELEQGDVWCFLYVLTEYNGVYRLQRLQELVDTYLPVGHYSGQPVRDENDETLRALRLFFRDADHQALLLGDSADISMEIDSYLRISDGELQLRYWRGRDKMIPYTANLRILADGGFEVLTNDPAVWNSSPDKPLQDISLDSVDPTRDLGAGIKVLWADKEGVVFYSWFGLFCYGWDGASPLFTVDFEKAVGLTATLEGDVSPNVTVSISDDGTQIFVARVERDASGKEQLTDGCLINVQEKTYTAMEQALNSDVLDSPKDGTDVSWGCDGVPILYNLWLEHDGERWYPCR